MAAIVHPDRGLGLRSPNMEGRGNVRMAEEDRGRTMSIEL